MRSTRLCTTPTESWRRSLASELIDGLFAQYAAAYSRGERPDAAEFLELAGPGAPKLSRLIDAFLARAPAPARDEETLALFDAFQAGESPLLRARVARGVKREAGVSALVGRIGHDPQQTGNES